MKNDNSSIEFWKMKEAESGEIKIVIINSKLIDYIESLGYRKMRTGMVFRIIQIENENIIDYVPDYKIRDDIRTYIGGNEELIEVWEKFLVKNALPKYIIEHIKIIEITYQTGSNQKGYLFYSNGVLEINSESIEVIPYSQFQGYVWKSQIIKREIQKTDFSSCDFSIFCKKLSGEDEARFNNLRCIVGYMLHSYKDSTITRAVILMDDSVNPYNSVPNGGTGKSLLAHSLSKLVPTCFKSGKQIDSSNRFFFSDVEEYDKVVIFDDVQPNFKFEDLFSMITGDLPVEKKYQNQTKIPFEYSPKVIISTNYIVYSYGNSAERRKVEFEVAPYFRIVKSPEDEFGRRMFDDWDLIEWNKFDNFVNPQNPLKIKIANASMINRQNINPNSSAPTANIKSV